MTATKNNEKNCSKQKKEVQDEARHLGLLPKKNDGLWTKKDI